MPVHNSDIAGMFSPVADFLEIEGANPFRVRAYRNAARIISHISHPMSDLVQDESNLTKYDGIKCSTRSTGLE
jgi:DNA polymerase (family X)